jgi:hypothetical protein
MTRSWTRLDVPSAIVVVEQQAGGVAMSYPVVMGAVLRLEPNRHRGLRDLEPLLRGMRAMAEEPDLKLLEREYKVLRSLVLTSGSAYTESELRTLQDYLADIWRCLRSCAASKRTWSTQRAIRVTTSRNGA